VKSPLFHIIWVPSLLLILPFSVWAAEEAPLAVVTPQFAPMQSMAAIGKLLVAFLIIGALMALLFKGMKKMGLGHGSMSKGGLISVLDTRMVAPKKYISVVRVAGEDLAIGISDNNLSLLCKLGPAVAPQEKKTEESQFADNLEKAYSSQNTEEAHA
jgi:flagellar biogenesis protein FliO